MNYTEAKKYIEKLRSEYNCKGDLIFRCAIQNVVEYGVVPLTENIAVEDWLSDIDNRHDEAEADGKTLWISRDFEKAIAECTFKLAKVGSMNLMMYVQREIWFQNQVGELDYNKALNIIKGFIDYEIDNCGSNEETLDSLRFVLDDVEIEALGYEWLFEKEE